MELTEKCPYCGEECEAEWVDVEVTLIRVTPFSCQNCGASEIGPYDEQKEKLTEIEKKTGWYKPVDW